MIEKAWIALKRLLGEIWMLKEILERTKKEKSYRESFYCLREYLYHRAQNVARKVFLVRLS